MKALSSLFVRSRQRANLKTKSSFKSRHERRRILGLEILEDRSMMAILVADALQGTTNTSISGTVYEDLNSNGVRDGGEDGVAG